MTRSHIGLALFYFVLPLLLSVMLPMGARAQFEHQLIRRMAVFPINVMPAASAGGTQTTDSMGAVGADSGIKPQALDETWWQIREELTLSRRFLVASRQFLEKSDVFQPRGELQPADVILLGKLLDAHALVTSQLVGRILKMQVFDGGNGQLLWRKQLTLHPSLTIADQLPGIARRLVRDFVASIPYQGFQTVDPLIGKPIVEEGDVMLSQVDVGATSQVQTGDPVQWIRLVSTNAAPVFQGGARIVVVAEGRVVSVEHGIATVELLRMAHREDIKEFALVQLPREAERLQADIVSTEIPHNVSIEIVKPALTPMEQFKREKRPLVTTMSWLSSVAVFLLLAF